VEYARNLSKGKSKKNDDEDIERPLGVEMPWFGMQFRTLGKREMGIEIGLVDSRGREGVVRCTSFKVGWCMPYHASIRGWRLQ